MKIAIDCRYYNKSGIGTFIRGVVIELLSRHPENFYLIIVNNDISLSLNCNCNVLKTNIKPFSLQEFYCFPVDMVNECDVYFSPYINIPNGIKIPIYTTIHDMLFFDVEGIVSPIGKIIRKWFYKNAIKKSKGIFTVSDFSKQRIQNHFKIDKEIRVIFNGISKRINDYPMEMCKEKENYFIFVGNIKPHKGLKTLIAAFLEAKKEGLKSKLLIVGNAEKFRTADNSINNWVTKNDSISFTGWISDEELIRYISRAKALVLPSFYEGFGIPPLEAMYLGTPTIISDIPVLKEIYRDFPVTFFKVGDVGDLKNKLLEIPVSYDSIKKVRLQIDEKYSFAKSASIILSTIQNELI